MRRFAYNNPHFNGEAVVGNTVITLTETEILDTYYRYWSGEMLRVHRAPKITEANCIDDFVVVNWAWEVTA